MAFNFPNAVPKFPAAVKGREIAASQPIGVASPASDEHPLGALPREDQDLIVQLVLHSGSLKDLAASYDVSYPTIRNRLDRVIERLRVIVQSRKPDGVRELLAQMVERGEVSPAAARTIGEAMRTQSTHR
ncbi:MAG: DUF2089 family protein [Planctomycetes bacterium]|nr:DUF2089 family protein [Planctomycetota bacterium]